MKAKDVEAEPFALTIHQPWAWAITAGLKRFENRTWRPPHKVIGKRIWIHASQRIDGDGVRFVESQRLAVPKDLPMGALIGTAVVTGFLKEEPPTIELPTDRDFTFQEMGEAAIGRVLKRWPDPWLFGPYGWLLEDALTLTAPIFCRGFQNVWTLAPETQRHIDRKAVFR